MRHVSVNDSQKYIITLLPSRLLSHLDLFSLLLVGLLVLFEVLNGLHHQTAMVELVKCCPVPLLVEDELEPVVVQSVLWDPVLVGRGVVEGRREDWVDSQSKCILHHARDYPPEERAAQLQARVSVDLYKPRLEGGVDHEVKTEQLKVTRAPVWVDKAKRSPDCINCDLLEQGVDVRVESWV
jgi:hypothetical protein